MSNNMELQDMGNRPRSSRGRNRQRSERGMERPSSHYSRPRHLTVSPSSQANIPVGRQPSTETDLDTIDVESEINGGSQRPDDASPENSSSLTTGHQGALHGTRRRVVNVQQQSLDPQWAIDCFQKPVEFLIYAYNLGFFFCTNPFYIGIKEEQYRLRSYALQIVPYAVAVTTTTIHLLIHIIFEYSRIDMDSKPLSGYETATDFIYLLCVLGHPWMLVVVRKKLQSFVQRFTVTTDTGMLSVFLKLTPVALLLLVGCCYKNVGAEIRLGQTEDVLINKYQTGEQMANLKICRINNRQCKKILAMLLYAIETFIDIQKFLLEFQMLSSSIFIRMAAEELEQQCSEFGDMNNSNIIKSTQLFSTARGLVGEMNKSNWALSIWYFTELFFFLVVSLFHIAQRDWPWLARNGVLLLLKLITPLVASSGTRKFAKAYAKIKEKLNYRHRETEGLLDPFERTERTIYRDSLIKDFEDAAKEPITLQCLGYYSVNEKWMIMLIGGVYGTSCFLLDLNLGIRRGASATNTNISN